MPRSSRPLLPLPFADGWAGSALAGCGPSAAACPSGLLPDAEHVVVLHEALRAVGVALQGRYLKITEVAVQGLKGRAALTLTDPARVHDLEHLNMGWKKAPDRPFQNDRA